MLTQFQPWLGLSQKDDIWNISTIKFMTSKIMIKYDCLCKNQLNSHKNSNSYLAQLLAMRILNSYPHTMSPVAKFKWSAFLRGGFTIL